MVSYGFLWFPMEICAEGADFRKSKHSLKDFLRKTFGFLWDPKEIGAEGADLSKI